MNDKVEIIKRGIIRAEEFEEFDRPLMGLVLLEIGFISFILGGTSVLLFFDLVLGYSHFGFTQVIYSLLATFLFFCLLQITMSWLESNHRTAAKLAQLREEESS